MRKTAWILAGAFALTTASAGAAEPDASLSGADQVFWARWQGRLALGTTSMPAWRLGVEGPAVKLSSASLMGDYYFAPSIAGPGKLGGFRATSGMIIGPRGSLIAGQPTAAASAFTIGNRPLGVSSLPYVADPTPDSTTLPYLGLGYSNLSVRSGWSFSADLGLVAQNGASAVRFGRALGGSQSLDDAIREMRLSPLLQLGASYSF